MVSSRAHIVLLLVIVFFSALSCKNNTLNKEEYVRWVQDGKNGLIKKEVFGSVQFELQYKPIRYIALTERNIVDNEALNETLDQLKGSEFYNLRISSIDNDPNFILNLSNSFNEYQELIDYLSYKIENRIYLSVGENVCSPEIVHFVPNYNLTPYVDVIIAFSEQMENRVLIYDDELMNLGKIKFSIKQSDIQKSSDIKLHL